MPSFDIIRKSQPTKTFRVASVMGTYDLQENSVCEHFTGSIEKNIIGECLQSIII